MKDKEVETITNLWMIAFLILGLISLYRFFTFGIENDYPTLITGIVLVPSTIFGLIINNIKKKSLNHR